jgi:3-oxoacyl-[acyl-carrier-protein] synthase-1
MKRRWFLSAPGIVSALGAGHEESSRRLFAGDASGMVLEDGWLPAGPARVGRAPGTLPGIADTLADQASRCNRLALAALAQIRAELETALSKFGRGRIGVVIGTSATGIAEGEAALAALRTTGALPATYRYAQQELGTPASFLARHLELSGPAYAVSTACTSSAKAFASARQLLEHGACDAVLVGGVDALCRLTICGFTALESTTTELSLPMSRNRRGINIGEGAALFLLSGDETEVELRGIGESSDAHHVSAPHPEGLGAEAAMRAALRDAGLGADDVDYLNLHATATPKNDEMESRAVTRVFPSGIATSGTKPMTGHTLGAAGALELAFCWLALADGRLPPHVWDGAADPALPLLAFAKPGQCFARSSGRVCMSNSFAFGGSNACLIIGDAR